MANQYVLLPTDRSILSEDSRYIIESSMEEFFRGRRCSPSDPNAAMLQRDLEGICASHPWAVVHDELMISVDWAEGVASTEEQPPHPLAKANATVAANIDTMFYWK